MDENRRGKYLILLRHLSAIWELNSERAAPTSCQPSQFVPFALAHSFHLTLAQGVRDAALSVLKMYRESDPLEGGRLALRAE